MKLLIVNLARAADRRAYMQRQLDALGLDYEFIKGTDYREMSEADFRALCHPRVMDGDKQLKGASAAALSHISAYRRIVEGELDFALVCEDDGVFPPHIGQILDTLKPHLQPDEVVMLSYYHHRGLPLVLTRRGATDIGDGLQLLAPTDIEAVASAMAYIVPRAVAARMAEALIPVDHVADYWGKFYRHGAFTQLRCLYPHVMKDAPFTALVEYPSTQTWQFKVKALLRKVPGMGALIRRGMQRKAEARYQFRVVNDEAPFWERTAPVLPTYPVRAG